MSRYQLVFFSSNEYQQLGVEIVFEGEEIAFVQQEEGINRLIIELYHNPKVSKIYLNDLIEALQEAKRRLIG